MQKYLALTLTHLYIVEYCSIQERTIGLTCIWEYRCPTRLLMHSANRRNKDGQLNRSVEAVKGRPLQQSRGKISHLEKREYIDVSN